MLPKRQSVACRASADLGAVVPRDGGILTTFSPAGSLPFDFQPLMKRRQGDVTGGMSSTTSTLLQPSSIILTAAAGTHPDRANPIGNEIFDVFSWATIGQQAPNQAILSSSRIGMARLASMVNEPTLATTFSSTALRAQLAASSGRPCRRR